MDIVRRLPIGTEIIPEGVSFRVWAPKKKKVEVVVRKNDLIDDDQRVCEMVSEGNGYFTSFLEDAKPGDLYSFRMDNSEKLYPDPASRFQPEGPHGPSEIIDPEHFKWTDENWEGVYANTEVIYEMHIGTFTSEGTYNSAAEHLPYLADLGITVLELMPLADFPGKFGWGYDGVNMYAPTRLYGRPDDLRRFINEAHNNGIAVILDVVYNHLGPDGNYLRDFSPYYFTNKYKTDWGDAINFDGQDSLPVREFFIENAGYWIEEFHFDGLRIDATQDIHDVSAKHVLAEISDKVREKARRRRTYIIGENEPQQVKLLKPVNEGGYGLNALWNDDFHHSAIVALTGKSEAYYTDYFGKPQEFISAFKYGFLYQGQYYKWQKKRRGSSALAFNQSRMIHFIENHDQVANSARGQRIHHLASPGVYRSMVTLTLLGPATPMLFQGQEFASTKPFYYFADHHRELADLVSNGRIEFLSQFRSIASPEMMSCVPDPGKADTFNKSKLDHNERESRGEWLQFHKDLLTLRRNDGALNGRDRVGIDGAVLSEQCFLIRFFTDDGIDRLMIVNLGTDMEYSPAPEPLIAPPDGMVWEVAWSSENPIYGGNGVPSFEDSGSWIIPGRSTTIFKPVFKGGRANAPDNQNNAVDK